MMMVAPHVQARNANRAGLLFAQKSCLNDNSARHSTAIEQRRELFLFFRISQVISQFVIIFSAHGLKVVSQHSALEKSTSD